MPGPSPTPSDVLKLRGSWRGNVNKNEPQPSKTKPRCPAWMDTEGKAAWREVVEALDSMGVCSETDQHAIAIYCDVYSRYKQARDVIDAEGLVMTLDRRDGEIVRARPEVKIANDCIKIMLQYQREFGLTPSSRSTVVVSKDDLMDETAKMFFGPQ